MKRYAVVIGLVFILFVTYGVTSYADTFQDISDRLEADTGLDEFEENLYESDRGFDPEALDEALSVNGILARVFEEFQTVFFEQSGILAPLLIIAVLLFIFSQLAPQRRAFPVNDTVGYVTVFVVAGLLFGLMQNTSFSLADCCKQMADFAMTSATVMASAAAVGGYAESAASAYAVFGVEVNLFSSVVSSFIVNGATMYVALAITASLTKNGNLEKISALFRKICVGSLTFTVCLFWGILSLKLASSSAADTLLRRVAHVGISSYIPIIGPSVSGGLDTVYACASAVQNRAGVLGVLAVAYVALVPFVRMTVLLLVTSVSEIAFSFCGNEAVTSFFTMVKDAVRILFAANVALTLAFLSGLGTILGVGS